MFLVLISILSIIVALIRRGSFSNLSDSGIRAWYLFAVSVIAFLAVKIGDSLDIEIIRTYSKFIVLGAYSLLLLGAIFNIVGVKTASVIDSIIIGVLTYFASELLKMPYPAFIAIIVGVTNIIPIFGPFIGAVPGAVIILMVQPSKLLVFILMIFVIQQIDGNIIGPKILGNTTGISEFWVTFALLLFGGIFGFLGMIIGVPAFAVIYYAVVQFMNKKLIKKGLPADSNLYREAENLQDLITTQREKEAEEEE